MIRLLVIIEALALLAGTWYLWRRSRSSPPGRARDFAVFVLALALHALVNLVGGVGIEGFQGTDAARSLNTAAAALLLVQVARTLLLYWAAYAWLRVVRPRLVRSWRGFFLLFCLVLVALAPGGSVAFGILMIIPVLRLGWTKRIHGWGRVAMVIALAGLTVALLTTYGVSVSGEGMGTLQTRIGGGDTLTEVEGELPGFAAAMVRLARPWEHAMSVLLVVLRLQVFLGLFQLLVIPVRLRGLSIKRRFTVTLAMYRFIPGTLALIFMVLIAYLAIGLHRASAVRSTFEDTLERGMHAADVLAGRPPATAFAAPEGLGRSARAFAVVRNLEWTTVESDSVDSEGWTGGMRAASVGTPDAVRERNLFAEVTVDSAAGVVAVGGRVYLRAARVARSGPGNGAVGAEVFVPVDSTYLMPIARDIQSDIHIEVSPRLFLGESQVTVVGEDAPGWTDSTFAVSARLSPESGGGGWRDHRFYLARTFLPVGNWLAAPGGDEPIGAIQLQLHTTPVMLYDSLTGSEFAITSQVFALVILVLIALLFIVVELSAVRTGRSIVQGIVSDVKTLTVAARKFGEGDLSQRVDLPGKDEMGQLAATFNSMAENIEQHQEVLREKERLEADLALARDIQQRMLPQSPPVIPGLDVAGLSIPSREVGGDLFYFLPVEGGRLGLTIGDVSGKSVPAALLMSNVLAALKSEARIVEAEDEILVHLNRLIVEQVEPGRFVTFFYGVVDPGKGSLRYACAGHNPPLLMRGNGETAWLEEAGVPLGVVDDSTYVPAEVTLDPGDVLVLYSDGVTEAQRISAAPGEDGEGDDDGAPAPATRTEFFDEERLAAAVREARHRSATAIVSHVMDAIRAFTGGAEQSDDVTLVVVRMTGPVEPPLK